MTSEGEMALERVERRACFGGVQGVYRHDSAVLGCRMSFAIYLPPVAEGTRVPVLYFLSGLTCTEQNFIGKAGAQRYAAEHGIAIVAPDTSPRGPGVADAEGYDIGLGAGFYVNASEAPWAAHYRMYDYVTSELPSLVESHFPVSATRSISGHSMGGHGALVCALKRPGQYRSVSAFSPIVAPTQVPWGRKAFTQYLGADESKWNEWDGCELIRAGGDQLELLVDQGEADEFLSSQLRPDLLESACAAAKRPLRLRRHAGYDHSYYFISTFIGEHIAYHAAALHS
ncbi:MAG TPA: S-formylglutathione hydrolase [Polyangiaceae bacterium]